MAQLKGKNVVVVGGSLGGLFAGIVLKRLGYNVRILERNPTPLLHDQGAGIVAGSHLQEILERYDLTNHSVAVTSRARQFLDKHGIVTDVQHHAQNMTSWDTLYAVLRANFDGPETAHVEAPPKAAEDGQATYNYGYTVTSVAYEKAKIKLGYVDKEGHEGFATADFVIAADGRSSTVRRLLLPEAVRRYAGYVAWRGTVPEKDVSKDAKAMLVENFTFYSDEGTQILCYIIPGQNGDLTPGNRLLNWVWYCNYPEHSKEYDDLMTDKDGAKHDDTLPVGKVQEEVWLQQQDHAKQVLPPQFAELVLKTATPFVQSITDSLSPKALFFDNHLLLLGDALAGFRPHTAASTSQAASHALSLAKVMKGEMHWADYEGEVLRFAKSVSAHGIAMGDQSQFGHGE